MTLTPLQKLDQQPADIHESSLVVADGLHRRQLSLAVAGLADDTA